MEKRKHYFKPELNQMFLIIILGVKDMVNILNLAEVQEQKQIDEITNCIVDSLINEVEKVFLKQRQKDDHCLIDGFGKYKSNDYAESE